MKKIILIVLFALLYSLSATAGSIYAYYSYPVSADKSAYKKISTAEITSDMKMVQSESSKWGDVYKTYVHSKCAKYQYDTTIGYNDSFLCTECENGYQITYSEQTCIPNCSEGCLNCLAPDACSACMPEYVFSNGKCVKSTIQDNCPAELTLSADQCCCEKK